MTEGSIVSILLKALPWITTAINSDEPERKLIAGEIDRNRKRLLNLFRRRKKTITWNEVKNCVERFEFADTKKVRSQMKRFSHLGFRRTPSKEKCTELDIAKRLANKQLPTVLQTFINNTIIMKEDIQDATGTPSELKGFKRRLREREAEIAAMIYIMKRK